MRAKGIAVGRVQAVLTRLIEAGPPVKALDHTTGDIVSVRPQLAAAPHGFLPLFLAAGDTVWREATGRSLGIDLTPDPQALLGLRVHAVASTAFAPVMLSMMEAIAQVVRPDMLLVNDLAGPWLAAQERLAWREKLTPPLPATPTRQPTGPMAGLRAHRKDARP
jgi:hypothetical protein